MTRRRDNGAAPGDTDRFTREETYAATRRPVELAQTLVPAAYTSDTVLARERERGFGASWACMVVQH